MFHNRYITISLEKVFIEVFIYNSVTQYVSNTHAVHVNYCFAETFPFLLKLTFTTLNLSLRKRNSICRYAWAKVRRTILNKLIYQKSSRWNK